MFADTWEQRKLGELGKFVSGVGFPESEQNGKSGTPFYKVSDMNNRKNESVMLHANHYVSEKQIVFNNWNVINSFPAIIFAKVGAAVFLDRKRIVLEPFLIDNNMMAFTQIRNLHKTFLLPLFTTLRLSDSAQTGSLPSISASVVSKTKLKFPDIKEQKRMGVLFQRLDATLTLQQREFFSSKHLCAKG